MRDKKISTEKRDIHPRNQKLFRYRNFSETTKSS